MGKRTNFANKASEAAALGQLVRALKRSSLTRTRPQLCISIVSFDATNEHPELAERPRISRRSETKGLLIKFDCKAKKQSKFSLEQCKPSLELQLPPEPIMAQAQSA